MKMVTSTKTITFNPSLLHNIIVLKNLENVFSQESYMMLMSLKY